MLQRLPFNDQLRPHTVPMKVVAIRLALLTDVPFTITSTTLLTRNSSSSASIAARFTGCGTQAAGLRCGAKPDIRDGIR